ncbi:hypothetical protein [Thiocapsa sp. UBA6158]|uniref:hypothetical protein n=1 Tax=Thiocapsa sp. UBA6158 TaxID=1947692 RepID=UPI0025ECF202|nr:hypothetical protein [Thiocapsa sp. UBA6158]
MNHDQYVIDHDVLELVTDLLLVGLQSFGEIERLLNGAKLQQLAGEPVPEMMRPIHPTGDAETVSKFADALRLTRNLPAAIEQAQH